MYSILYKLLIYSCAIMMNAKLSQELTERGWVPDTFVRRGIQTLLKQRLKDINATDSESQQKRR